MSWAILIVLCVGLLGAVAWTGTRRIERLRTRRLVGELATARERGSRTARLQYPQVDLARCLGCATCVAACPEEGVLEMLHGQAVVVHGARCVGHGLCAQECPTGAIVVALGDLEERRDIPAIGARFESTTVRGLFLAGEVTGFALIRTAITHGVAVAREVAARVGEGTNGADRIDQGDLVDLVVVGAGPAGMACAIEARELGLSVTVLEQDTLGGTVASYPRRKLVMTQPIVLPGGYRLHRSSYEKEELMKIWEQIVERSELSVRTGVRVSRALRATDGAFDVTTSAGDLRARHVCLALGRRGTPRKLGVPGEELPKVAFSLLDAESYVGRRILVVGGGDSAIEAALGLAHQEGNEVTLSYRRHAFFRIKARNEERIGEALRTGEVRVLFQSQVTRISPAAVELLSGPESNQESISLPNDDVFVLAGGIPPFEMLGECGISFDPKDREAPATLTSDRSGLFPALVVASSVATLALAGVVLRSDYYSLSRMERPRSEWHDLLKPSGSIGLTLGVVAAALLLVNLSYLLRRSPGIAFRLGSLRTWMTSHVATGLLTLLFAVLHSAMELRQSVGGHALIGLAVLAITGVVGRYFYSFVPHAANGRELDLEEVQAELATLAAEWDRDNRAFGDRVRAAMDRLVPEERWRATLPRRVAMLLRAQIASRRMLAQLRRDGVKEGIPADQLERTIELARRAQRNALGATHFEDLRGILVAWRYFHRWVALLLVLLISVHVFVAYRYGGVFS